MKSAARSWFEDKRKHAWMLMPFLRGAELRYGWYGTSRVVQPKNRFDDMAIAKNNAKQARKAALRLEAK